MFKKSTIHYFDAEKSEKMGKGFVHKGTEYIHYSDLLHDETAFFRLSSFQHIVLVLAGIMLFCAFAFSWHITVMVLLVGISCIYFSDIFFNLFLIVRSFLNYPEISFSEQSLKNNRKTWPKYTVLCPLYKEWRVIPQFVKAIERLEYPKEKLQVLLLLEEDDTDTLFNVKKMKLPSHFEIVVVPHSLPKTKPKACNFGMTLAKGEYIVIYDAEDIPDTNQLKKAVLAFEQLGEKVICVQAKLNFYNPSDNLLTRFFTAEYSLWFDLILTGLLTIRAPIPLGGTSNHFRFSDLKTLKGWDAFNVTEDCDLGIRIAKKGYQTAIIDSTTYEEANSHLGNWFGQRTRWIKGYMQSYLVHTRNIESFAPSLTNHHFYFFQLIIGAKILSLCINPILWAITILYFAFRSTFGVFLESLFPGPILYIGVFSAVVGNFLYLYYYMIGCAKRGYYDLILIGWFVPFYWILMSFSTWNALYKIIREPHYWFKTKHGLRLHPVYQGAEINML